MPSIIFKSYSGVLVFKTEQFKAQRFFSSGSTCIKGKKIDYDCISEDNLFYSEDNHPIASIFSFSYFKKTDEDLSKRPVIFAFNGGPGASSVMLHTALLGPKRVCYNDDLNSVDSGCVDNAEWLLDIADIVLVDPVGTGFGTLLDKQYASSFYGIKEDAEAFVAFVEMWLERYGRYSSPKYIIAESYGCARAAMALEIASGQGPNRCYDISFEGVVFIGNTISDGKYFNVDHCIPLDQWVAEARNFANSEYLLALNKGYFISKGEKDEVVSKIMHFTGVDKKYLLERNLRIDSYSVKNEILGKKGLCVSRLDGRIVRELFQLASDESLYGVSSDRARGLYNPLFMVTLIDSIFPLIGIKNFNRLYISQFKISSEWNKSLDLSLSKCLEKVMKRNSSIQFYFANGYFDLTTEIGGLEYMLSHTDLDMDRCVYKGYPTGHMVYLGNSELKVFSSDLRTFIAKC